MVSPIWISLARALWGSRGSTGVLTQAVGQGEAAAKPLLEQLRKRELIVPAAERPRKCGGRNSSWPLNRERLRQLLQASDGLLPNSWLKQAIRSDSEGW